MQPMQPQLTPIQTQAIELLASGTQVGCIANTLGIRRETLWRWRQEPEFGKAWQAEREKAMEQLRSHVEEVVKAALNVLQRELTADASRYARPQQVPAALALLRILSPTQLFSTPPREESLYSLPYSQIENENPTHSI